MKKMIIGIGIGATAGVLDVIPMIFQKLPVDANISAFMYWCIVGFFVTTCDIGIKGVPKGIIIAFLVLVPSAILIGYKEPVSLIPISAMTLILGSLVGFTIEKLNSKKV